MQRFAVLGLSGAAFQLAIVAWLCADFDVRVPRLLPDDAMYYLKIAQNIAAGSGSVFSVGEPTNGYHPLWMLLLVGVAAVASPSAETFVAVALVLAVLCNAGATWFLRRLLLQLGCGEGAALLGVALYWTLPWAVHLTLTGLETPLYLLCLLAFVSSYYRVGGGAGRGAWIGLGVWAGLLMLSRTDAVLFTAPLFVALLFGRGLRVLPAAAGSAALAALLVAPWLVWNLLRFGTIVQSSGIAMSVLGHADAPPLSAPFAYAQRCIDHALTILCRFVAQPFLPTPAYDPASMEPPYLDPAFGGRAALVIGVSALLVVALGRRVAGRRALLPGALLWPGVGLAAFYLCVRLYAQVWHFSCLVPLAVIGIARAGRWQRPVFAVGAVLIAAGASVFALRHGYFSPQRDFVTGARSLRADSGERLRIGITDSGYAGVFSRHEIVNLDGVVNNAVLRSILAGRISDYLAASDLDEVRIQKWRFPFYDRNTPLGPDSHIWRQARIVDYEPGARIPFNSRDAEAFLLLGWSSPEAEYRWSDGEVAWVGFGLRRPEPLVLTLAAHALGGQRVGLELNGRSLATLDFPATGVAERSVPIDAALLQRHNGLVFRLNEARSPRSMGLGLDGRRLGIAVRWLALRRRS